ncbi:uncharacterized protein [Watersipora subatra]|uniref:uncharacterized protein n=1 Tax=Watersipora subatra TaxID=2589382 RepID=UPI00355B4D9B
MIMDDKRIVMGTLQGRTGRIVSVTAGDSVPEGAIPINRTIVGDMKKMLLKSKPPSEIWPTYSQYIIAGSNYISAVVLTYNLRRKLKIFHAARALSYVFAPIGPSLLAGVIHELTIMKSIYNEEDPSCPVCLPLRAACLNLAAGWAVPTAISLLTTTHVARQTYSYPVPTLTDYRALSKELNKVTMRIRPLFAGSFVLAAILPFVLTRQEKVVIESAGSISLHEYEAYVRRLQGKSDSEWGIAETPR